MNKYTVRMERSETVPECTKTRKVLWEYVLEPLDKATYWDHAPLLTEERRAQSNRTLKIAKPDGVKNTTRCKETLRCDALFKKESTNVDVLRTVTTYTTR